MDEFYLLTYFLKSKGSRSGLFVSPSELDFALISEKDINMVLPLPHVLTPALVVVLL